MDLNVDTIELAEEREDDVKKLLVVALGVGVFSVGDGEQIGLEQLQGTVDVFLA